MNRKGAHRATPHPILYRIPVPAGVLITAFRSRGERFPAGRSYGLA